MRTRTKEIQNNAQRWGMLFACRSMLRHAMLCRKWTRLFNSLQCYANADADADANVDANADADANVDADAYAVTDADADADADANVENADAYDVDAI